MFVPVSAGVMAPGGSASVAKPETTGPPEVDTSAIETRPAASSMAIVGGGGASHLEERDGDFIRRTSPC